MKKFLILCALVVGIVSAKAQTVIDNFTVGPYVVDYNGQGDVKYRLRDNIDLYDYFELQRDTVIKITNHPGVHVKSALQISATLAAGLGTTKTFDIQGQYKLGFANCWHFNAGVSLGIANHRPDGNGKYNILEVGVPLQIEYGIMTYGKSSLYALAGVTPIYYNTLSASNGNKKSSVMVAPGAEVGGNIPVDDKFLRIGAFCSYKISETYHKEIGRAYIGGKIGFIF